MAHTFIVNFSVSDFQAGASSIEVPVTETSVLSAYRLLVQNVSGGAATLNVQFSAGGKPAEQKNLVVDSSTAPGNSLAVPKGADKAVVVFDEITFPMGTVVISVNS